MKVTIVVVIVVVDRDVVIGIVRRCRPRHGGRWGWRSCSGRSSRVQRRPCGAPVTVCVKHGRRLLPLIRHDCAILMHSETQFRAHKRHEHPKGSPIFGEVLDFLVKDHDGERWPTGRHNER